jgi:hypothetical protein
MLDLDKEAPLNTPVPVISTTRVLCPNPECKHGALRLRFAYPDRTGAIYNCMRCGLWEMTDESIEESPSGQEE